MKVFFKGSTKTSSLRHRLFLFVSEFRTVSYSGNCTEQVADFAQNMLVFVLPLKYFETDITER